MYALQTSYASFSPSPPSSPTPYVDSSSPPSSPAAEAFHLDDDDIAPAGPTPVKIAHPYAASASNWKPPNYEKKRPTSPITPPSTIKKARLAQPVVHATWHTQSSPTANRSFSPSTLFKVREPTELDVWNEASTDMFDGAHGAVDLENKNLTRIPESFIKDLSKFIILPESSEPVITTLGLSSMAKGPTSRSASIPVSNWRRTLQRTRSTAAPSLGLPRHQIQLFLACNAISTLPLSMFYLQNLTVLSLRNNKITFIPPEIVGLKNLKNLNIAQNQIEYLPSEMLQMSLEHLQVHPNNFIRPPGNPALHFSTTQASRGDVPATRRPVSIIKQTSLPRIPPLVEILFRTLFSTIDETQETLLERYYDLPSVLHSANHLPSHIRNILSACVPPVIDDLSKSSPVDDNPVKAGIGLCPSPKHQLQDTRRVFLRHAEERYSWEKMVATVDVGGLVPQKQTVGENTQFCPDDSMDNMDLIQDSHLDAVVQLVDLESSRQNGLEDFDD
ncbi:hypothetical protein H0H81_000695 [Sphagnurus paluster]|uniref:Uncharacterized protein n=1 Tax=Sphagnurus paluster TaxID=117069 RepID=A0A9P7GNL8_9AGAR|nr:hypothetical protein H0H81_000695 [Sphagnurus paluster]